MNQPRQLDNVLYSMIRDEKIAAFNREKPSDAPIDFRGGDFRGPKRGVQQVETRWSPID